jgi:hypothetical protein
MEPYVTDVHLFSSLPWSQRVGGLPYFADLCDQFRRRKEVLTHS